MLLILALVQQIDCIHTIVAGFFERVQIFISFIVSKFFLYVLVGQFIGSEPIRSRIVDSSRLFWNNFSLVVNRL